MLYCYENDLTTIIYFIMQTSVYLLYLISLACILANAAGQLLFKLSAEVANKNQNSFSIDSLLIISGALALYFIAAIGWSYVLRVFDLSHIYPLMALAFILVPIGGVLFFNEKIDIYYYFGTTLIILGIIICIRYSNS